MARLYFKAVWWWPVIVRGALWVVIAVGTAFLDKTTDLTPEKVAAMGWVDWARMVVMVGILPAAITVRTFIDQTLSRHKSENSSPSSSSSAPL